MTKEQIFNAIKERRNALSIKQTELKDATGLGRNLIHAIESGEGNPTIENLLKIADVLGMKITISSADDEMVCIPKSVLMEYM